MMDEELAKIVKDALPLTKSEVIGNIVAHLISNEVGVESIDDLQHVTQENLQPLKLPPIRIKKLMLAFKASQQVDVSLENTNQNDSAPGCSSSGNDRRSLSIDRSGRYNFVIRWKSLPDTLVKALEAKDLIKERADPGEECELKLAISKKLQLDYTSFKDSHPGSQKHPGVKIYRSIGNQVFDKFPECFKDIVNRNVVGDGKSSFIKSIQTCTENLLRDKKQQTPRQRAVRANGVVGVLPEQYEPHVPNSIEQEATREALQNMHKLNPNTWNENEIERDMMITYELQREDVVKIKEKIYEPEEGDEEREEGEPDQNETKAMSELKLLWPFLFQKKFLSQQHNRLTGRILLPHVKEFMTAKNAFYMMFLTSSSASNVQNLAHRLDAEVYFETGTYAPKKLMCTLKMVANHFKEDLGLLLIPVERTTQLQELHITDADACIVALGENIYEADKFFISVDGVGLMEVADFVEALVALVELCFIFDIQYPKMPHTFEFLERCILQMAISNTRVKDKRGKELMVLTAAVRDMVNGEEKFEEELRNKRAAW